MALTNTYVDPSIAADSGTGTVGDPYGDIQYALNTMTRDGVNGDRINIKAGTDEILASGLTLATYGTPTAAAPLMFRGYTSAAEDGGIGGIDGNNGNFSIMASTAYDYIIFIDIHMHNTGSAMVCRLDNYCFFYNCEINNSSGGGLRADLGAAVIGCYLHDLSSHAINGVVHVLYNTFENGTKDFTNAVFQCTNVFGNVISIDGSSNGITTNGGLAIGNSIYSSSGTGKGITTTSLTSTIILSNIVEGFSGVGGIGINIGAGSGYYTAGFNAFYNNTTNFSNSADHIYQDYTGNDQALGASPFTDAGAGDFTVSTAVQALGYPTANYPNLSVRSYTDIGALQRQETAGHVTFGMRRIPI